MRFTLKYLLAAVAFVAFGCVALYNANEAWADVSEMVTVVVLLTAIAGAVYSQPRAFFVGFCIVGWGFLLLSYPSNPLFTTSHLLDVARQPLERTVEGPVPPAGVAPGLGLFPQRSPRGDYLYTVPIRTHFHTVGHSLFALIFAIIGGIVGQWFSRTRKNETSR